MSSESIRIEQIRALFRAGAFGVSLHASDELRKDGLGVTDAVNAVLRGAIAEDNSNRCCCIVSGIVDAGFALHVVVDYRRPDRAVIVTAYVPQSDDWVLPNALRRR